MRKNIIAVGFLCLIAVMLITGVTGCAKKATSAQPEMKNGAAHDMSNM